MTWLKNLNAMPKLMLGFGTILAFTIGIGVFGIRNLDVLAEQNDVLLNKDVAGLVTIKEFEVTTAKIAATAPLAIIAASGPNAKAEVDKQQQQFDELFQQLQSQAKVVASTVHTADLKKIVDRIGSRLPEYRQCSSGVFQDARSGIAGRAAALLKLNAECTAELNRLARDATKVKVANLQNARAMQANRTGATRVTTVTLLLAAVLVGLVLSFLVSRSFSRPLIAIVNILEKLSKGDLSHRLAVTSSDEMGVVGESLNRAMENMDRALSEVGSAAKRLSEFSEQLASAAGALASGAQEQAASLEETSTSLEEITAAIRQNSDNATHASQLALSSKDSAEKGGAAAMETVAAMGEIRTSSAKISDIISAIDEIAFQTNLLSVNASVEAARAGVHGNGFKVVAIEIRNLAQRSASSAREIKSLITSSVRKVENGSNLVTNSGVKLNEIVTSVKRVSDIVGEIAAASQEQATGIEQIARAMTQMDHATQSNSSQTERLSATVESLATQSSHLYGLVSRFVLSNASEPALAHSSKHYSASVNLSLLRPDARERTLQADPIFTDGIREEVNANLQSMAKNVGHSFLSDMQDKEFGEF